VAKKSVQVCEICGKQKMNVREEILVENSKAQWTKIVDWVGNSQQRFDELFHLFLTDEYRVTQRAGWPVTYCVEAHPDFIKNNYDKLIKNLQKPTLHDAVKRSTIRLLQYVDIPKKYQGAVMDICFTYVESPVEAVATKAFALTVLGNLAKHFPEIIPEIKLIIEDQLPHQTAAFTSRANKLLNNWKAVK
jgi:hypothetical protein